MDTGNWNVDSGQKWKVSIYLPLNGKLDAGYKKKRREERKGGPVGVQLRVVQ